ncbi:MAG: c-type cytochrome [Gemmatimonadetes bacterium]|nr:c-type cytochrome [Gemmatimonadota bacterium]
MRATRRLSSPSMRFLARFRGPHDCDVPSAARRPRERTAFLSVLAILTGQLTLPGPASGQGMAQRGEEREAPLESGETLYIEKGCLGCHGASGRGGVGPSLIQTPLSFEAFRAQVRSPRAIMPPFPHEVVNDEELQTIYEYVRALPQAAPRIRAELPRGTLDPTACADCHRRFNPTIVAQFAASTMGRPGVQNPRVTFPRPQMSCADCHGTNHDSIMASKGRVPETTCAACHAQIYQEHVLDAGHSYGPGPGELGINWERNIGVPHYNQMPRKVMEMGCDPCHAQAGATDARYWSDAEQKYVDTSSLPYRNGCIACHTRHAFNLEEARKPEACFTCHMGPDHPNYEAYMSSKHGSIYAARGRHWDWTRPLPEATWDAPTCAYCHMIYVGDDGARYASHNMTRKIVWGMGVQAALGQVRDITATPENQAKRNEMVKVCLICHSEDKARSYLESADAHKLAGDALVLEGQEILRGLYEEGLIEPSHGQVSAGLLRGPRFTAIEMPGGIAFHSPTSLYYDVTPIERDYFDMFFFANLKSYKGAFHMSPDYAWWYGYADVLGHLAAVRNEAQRLRDEDATRKRTLFMIFTGPLMVLAVLGALYLARRTWFARRGAAGG